MEDEGRRRARIFLSALAGVIAAVLGVREAASPGADFLQVIALGSGAFVAFFILFVLVRQRDESGRD
jgi:hypothetical protein